ncbi:unnamed protein product [Soboliphyme baturini]|uniref:Secreted protein n=1 Tax=Soboliphyme baturini TaxID=241478 RepID=A0A183ITN2_9BILA|nr:unnamed protein product [Soboliphyme baturini]
MPRNVAQGMRNQLWLSLLLSLPPCVPRHIAGEWKALCLLSCPPGSSFLNSRRQANPFKYAAFGGSLEYAAVKELLLSFHISGHHWDLSKLSCDVARKFRSRVHFFPFDSLVPFATRSWKAARRKRVGHNREEMTHYLTTEYPTAATHAFD